MQLAAKAPRYSATGGVKAHSYRPCTVPQQEAIHECVTYPADPTPPHRGESSMAGGAITPEDGGTSGPPAPPTDDRPGKKPAPGKSAQRRTYILSGGTNLDKLREEPVWEFCCNVIDQNDLGLIASLMPSTVTTLGFDRCDLPMDLFGLELPAAGLTELNLRGWGGLNPRMHGPGFNVSVSGLNLPDGLRVLSLRCNQLVDVSGLRLPTSLKVLDLGDNHIVDVSAVSGLTLPKGLEYLDLQANEIVDVTGLELPPGLTDLDLSANQIVDVSAVSGLTLPVGLEKLYLNHNLIVDVTGLDLPPGLKMLDLLGNFIVCVAGLTLPKGLESLNLRYNPHNNDMDGMELPNAGNFMLLQ